MRMTTGARASRPQARLRPREPPHAGLLDGDDYVLNGQRSGISTAHIAKWGLFLVRTDPTAIERGVKHEGITSADRRQWRLTASSAGPIRDINAAKTCSTRSSSPTHACRRSNDSVTKGRLASRDGTLGRERVGTAGLAITMKADLESIGVARRVP